MNTICLYKYKCCSSGWLCVCDMPLLVWVYAHVPSGAFGCKSRWKPKDIEYPFPIALDLCRFFFNELVMSILFIYLFVCLYVCLS